MSFIFSLECSTCEEDLESEAIMDDDKDILMTVKPCQKCLETAKMEGLKHGEKIYKPKSKDETTP